MEKAYIGKIREVQSVTGPNMCLASSKFLALKLLGFVDPQKHLWDFLRSEWARKNARLPLANYWGDSMALFNDSFNKVALPAVINERSAGVKAVGTGRIRAEYVGRRSVARRPRGGRRRPRRRLQLPQADEAPHDCG